VTFTAVVDSDDDLDDLIAFWRQMPGCTIEKVSTAWIESGPDAGRIAVEVRMREHGPLLN
jgi:hypothetical protein